MLSTAERQAQLKRQFASTAYQIDTRHLGHVPLSLYWRIWRIVRIYTSFCIFASLFRVNLRQNIITCVILRHQACLKWFETVIIFESILINLSPKLMKILICSRGNVFQNIIAWRVLIINFDLLFPHFISNEFLASKWVLKQHERSDEFLNKMDANIGWSH